MSWAVTTGAGGELKGSATRADVPDVPASASHVRKALCCLATGPHQELLAIAQPTFAAYAARHGYDLVVRTEAPEAGERPSAWAKIPLLRELLRSYDLVLWLDADVVIADDELDLADELDDDRFLAICAHHHSRQSNPNTGVMLLRAGAEADELLERTWALDDDVDHPWWEQASLLRVLGYEVHPHPTCRLVTPDRLLAGVQFVGTEWNSVHLDPAPHTRFLHLAGLPHEERRAAALQTAAASAARRERRARQAGPRASVLVAPLSVQEAWDAFVAIAELPEEPEHEIVVLHYGLPGLDDLLTQLDGDLTVVRPSADFGSAGALLAAASAAAADVVVLAHGVTRLDPGWLERRVRALGDPATAAVFCAYPTAGADATSVALRRCDLLALGRELLGAPVRREAQALATALRAAGRHVVVEPGPGVEQRPPGAPAPVLPLLNAREELPALLTELGLDGTGVEVGVQLGLFSEQILQRWPRGTLISVDPWRAFGEDYDDIANVEQAGHDARYAATVRRLARFGQRSEIWRMTGDEAAARLAPHSLDFVYLDARHDRAAVDADLRAWFDRVRPGGIIAGHDYVDGQLAAGAFGVRSAVDAFFAALGLPVHVTLLDGPFISWYVQVPAELALARAA